MKILVDTNVILDVILMRDDFLSPSYRVMRLCADEESEIKGYAAAHTITNAWFILRKYFQPSERREHILDVFKVLEIVSINGEMLQTALKNFEFADFEDCLQDECAAAVDADYIVTRDTGDFAKSKTPALTPEEFIAKFEQN